MTEETPDAPVPQDRVLITRETLRSGELLARVRRTLLPGTVVRSDAEIEASLDEILAGHDVGADAWVFAYGSLLWNPAFHFAGRAPARLDGWHRRYAIRLRSGRGTPEQPGLMLALDRGGSCEGIAYRIAAPVRDELLLIWRREMFGGSYLAEWVEIELEAGPVRAITFVANPEHPNYVARLTDEETAGMIARASGVLGTCREYLDQTRTHLHEAGLSDAGLDRLAALVREG